MKKTRMLASLILSIILILGSSGSVLAAKSEESKIGIIYDILIDEKPYAADPGDPQPYFNSDGRLMVPIRFISKNLGVPDNQIVWDEANQTAKITKDDTTIKIVVGSQSINVNGQDVSMDTTAVNNAGNIFVPVRYIAEGLGADVEWDPDHYQIHILTDKTNNFIRYGLKKKVDFPYTVEDAGIRYTLLDLHIYPVNSDDTKQYIDQYKLTNDENGTPAYFMWAHVKMENISDEIKRWDAADRTLNWEISSRGSTGLSSYPGMIQNRNMYNNPNYLFMWKLDPKESLTSYQGFFVNDISTFQYIDLDGPDKSFGSLAKREP